MPMTMYNPIANQAAGLFLSASKEMPLFDQNTNDHLFFFWLVVVTRILVKIGHFCGTLLMLVFSWHIFKTQYVEEPKYYVNY